MEKSVERLKAALGEIDARTFPDKAASRAPLRAREMNWPRPVPSPSVSVDKPSDAEQLAGFARPSPPVSPTNLAVERRFCCLSLVLSPVVWIISAFVPNSEPPGQSSPPNY